MRAILLGAALLASTTFLASAPSAHAQQFSGDPIYGLGASSPRYGYGVYGFGYRYPSYGYGGYPGLVGHLS